MNMVDVMTLNSVPKSMLAMFSYRLIGIFLVTVCVSQAQVMDGDIRIVSDNPREGHVEVFLEDEWGTISTIEFDEATTTVVCRQQGFQGPAESIKSTEHLGPLSSPEWNIMCSEGAESILECDRSKREGNVQVLPYMNFTFTSWKHDNDLGVICKDPQTMTPTQGTSSVSRDVMSSTPSTGTVSGEPSSSNTQSISPSFPGSTSIPITSSDASTSVQTGTQAVTSTEKKSSPTRMLVVDVALSLLLIAFILLFAYLAYYCAKRGETTPPTTTTPNPDPSSNDGYFTTIDAPKYEYARCVVVEERALGEAEDIKMKDMTIVEDKVVHSYFTFT
ncbi:uncharacterized protein [Apostichopus japonicus]|uniref:uncharacterized protein isoform X1 n=1 Tax=Stichopus japonicus TaxID=307972 RepID=UPI003AB118D1